MTSRTHNSIAVKWVAPDPPQGQLVNYKVTAADGVTTAELITTETQLTITGLKAVTKYTITVAAMNEGFGYGPAATILGDPISTLPSGEFIPGFPSPEQTEPIQVRKTSTVFWLLLSPLPIPNLKYRVTFVGFLNWPIGLLE